MLCASMPRPGSFSHCMLPTHPCTPPPKNELLMQSYVWWHPGCLGGGGWWFLPLLRMGQSPPEQRPMENSKASVWKQTRIIQSVQFQADIGRGEFLASHHTQCQGHHYSSGSTKLKSCLAPDMSSSYIFCLGYSQNLCQGDA